MNGSPLDPLRSGHGPDRLNYRQIEAFKAVFECGSMTLAAEQLGISQPAISNLVRLLEARIGFALFLRTTRRLTPTAEALIFYEDVERALTGIDMLGDTAQDLRDRRRGRLAIGAVPALSLGFIQALVTGFHIDRPEIRIDLQTRTSPQLLSLVASRQLDIAVIADIGRNPMVHFESRHRIAMVCVLPPDHRLAGQPVVHANDLEHEQLISLSILDLLGPRIRQSLHDAGIHPKISITTGITSSACAFVAEGAGVAVVDPFSAAQFTPDKVVMRRFEPTITFDIAVIRPDELKSSTTGLTMAFASMLQQRLETFTCPA